MTLSQAIEAGARAAEIEIDRDMEAWMARWTSPGGIYDDAPAPPKSRWSTSTERIAAAVIRAAFPIIAEELIGVIERDEFDLSVRLDPARHKNLSDWFRDRRVAALRAKIEEMVR
jgi:hypothetical protein